MRSFSSKCAAVSLPLPVTFNHKTRFSESTLKESMPFGDKFILPELGAVATKNIF